MIDGTEKPKIPSKFSKRAARYNEFRYKPVNVKPCTVLLLPSSIIAVNILDEAFTDMPVFALVLIPSR